MNPLNPLRRLLPMRLRWRLTTTTVLLVAAALGAVGIAQYVALQRYVLGQTFAGVKTQAAVMGKVWQRQSRTDAPPIPGSLTAVYDIGSGQVVAPRATASPAAGGSDAAHPRWIDPTPEQLGALSPAGLGGKLVGSGGYLVVPTPGGDVMLTAFPLDSRTLLVVETSLSGVDALLEADVAIFSVAAALALLSAAALAAWFTSRALSPLERVSAVAREISRGAYDRRTGLHGDGEVARLATAFDEMVDRLEAHIQRERESEARMRRLLADASHELRTPLTGLLGHVEVLRRGAMDNRSDLEESLASMQSSIVRMSRLVQEVLAIARLEQTETRLRSEPVDVEGLLQDAERAARSSTREHVVWLDLTADGLAVLGDRDALERVLVNLIDNAARYSPAGSTIRLGARSTIEGQVELTVSDEGPSIPPADRERIFERLYRGDDSRTASDRHGAGLGLAMCRALARRQGGEIAVRDAATGGSTFVVSMPCASLQ